MSKPSPRFAARAFRRVNEPYFIPELPIILFLNKMISSFYLSRFTADRLGGGKKCIDFVF